MKDQSPLLPSLIVIGVLFLIALAIVKPIGPSPEALQPGPMIVTGGDYQSLSNAVSRVFGPKLVEQDTDGRAVFRVGELPPGMPFELPMPPDTTLVASISNQQPDSAEIIMDSKSKAKDIAALYQKSFAEQGFVEEPLVYNTLFHPLGETAGLVCRSRDSVTVDYEAKPSKDGPTAIWVYANWHVTSVSCLARNGEGVLGVAEKLLPDLKTPAGSVVTGEIGSTNLDPALASQEVEVAYAATPPAMFDFLAPQLRAAGWTLNVSTSSQYGAWSTWSLKDAEGHPWAGSLVIISGPISNRVSIRVEVSRLP